MAKYQNLKSENKFQLLHDNIGPSGMREEAGVSEFTWRPTMISGD